MRVDFQQGIITYPTSSNQQVFLYYNGGYVSLQTDAGRVDITFAHGTENYLFTESTNTINAWGPLTPSTNYWLYWDINLLTGNRTFGYTTLQPLFGSTQPSSPAIGQHWFDTTNKIMQVYQTNGWATFVRVFAAKVNSSTFTALGSGYSNLPFAGTQVGLTSPSGILTGRILVDDTGTPISRRNGELFTTEDDFFINGSPVNTIRLESDIVNGAALEPIGRFQVVMYTNFGKINVANYNAIQTTVIAMSMEDLLTGEVGELCVQGVITNPTWNWLTVGAPLWVDDYGLLTSVDLGLTDSTNHPITKVPIARVLTQNSIYFDQGMGGKGDPGEANGNLPIATTTVLGIAKLTVPATDPNNPLVVETNDPRLLPYVLPTLYDNIVLSNDVALGTPHGMLTGVTVEAQLNQLADRALGSLSDVQVPAPTTGYVLTWNGTKWVAEPSAIGGARYLYQLLDVTVGGANNDSTAVNGNTIIWNGSTWNAQTQALANLADVVLTAPAASQVLEYNGTDWVNATLPVAQGELNPIQLVNLMGDDLIDAPIAIPATGGFAVIDSTSQFFFTNDNLNLSGGYGGSTYHLRVNVNGTTTTVNFNSNSVLTYQDVITTINAALSGTATATYVVTADPLYGGQLTAQIVITSVATGYNTYVSLIDGLYDAYYGTQPGSGIIQAIRSTGIGGGGITIQPNGVYGKDAVYANYADEYYIVGALPTNTVATAGQFTWNFSFAVTLSTPLHWTIASQTFSYFIQGDSSVSVITIPNTGELTTLGGLIEFINVTTRLVASLNTVTHQLVITIPVINPYTSESAPTFRMFDNGVFTNSSGLLSQFTDSYGSTSYIWGSDIPGTPTGFQPGIWARSALLPGELVTYDNLGRWKSLGPAAEVLNGRRVGIALRPQSGRLASGTFVGLDGQIGVYTA